MKIAVLETGETVYRYKKSLVVSFAGKRRVLSTAPHNGGYRENLTAVFNHDATVGAGMACTLRAPTYAQHMALIAAELGLDPNTAAGLSTAAQMENASVKTEKWEDLSVTAVVTGGIEVNGGRVGDTASWNEVAGKALPAKPGTINIMLFFNTDLAEGTLARALVTCTEAKTAAIQELLAPSRYSMGLATGSGTDGTILVANRDSGICLTDAGKHSKLGELIGKAVKAAVKEALNFQSELNPVRQHQVVRRMDRFGITNDVLWTNYSGRKSRAEFEECLEELLRRDGLVTYTSLYAHLLDQLMWGMLSAQEVTEAAADLRAIMEMEHAGGRAGSTAVNSEAKKESARCETGITAGVRENRMESAGGAESAAAGSEPKFVLAEATELPAGSAAQRDTILTLIREYGAGLMRLVMREE